MSRYKSLFLSETGEHLKGLERELIELERNPANRERIAEVFRHIHSIKGMSASMGYGELMRLAHCMEDLLASHRESGAALEVGEMDVLLKGCDEIAQRLQTLTSSEKDPPVPSALIQAIECELATRTGSPRPVEEQRFADDGEDEDDDEEDQSGVRPMSSSVLRGADEAALTRVRSGASELPAPVGDDPVAPSEVRVRTELLDYFVNAVGELISLRFAFEEIAERWDLPPLRDGLRKLNTLVHQLHDRAMQVRMVSCTLLTQQLPRLCRDIARSRDKRIRLEVSGENVELDRVLVESLHNPLLHLLRNAIDHGIETPPERSRVGKSPEGCLRLSFRRSQDRVLIELADDGRGLDAPRVRAKAEELGLVDAEAPPLTPDQVLALIFRPGFSTGEGVSELSGRGVGLDVVQASLRRLGGRITVTSTPGQGTHFLMDLPFSLAILPVLLMESGGHRLAMPATRVMRAVALQHPEQLALGPQGNFVELGGQRYPFVDLLELLEGDSATLRPMGREVLLLSDGEKPALALGVDRLTGQREVLLKGVGRILQGVGPYSGSTIIGDGRPVLVLDPDGLLAMAARRKEPARVGSHLPSPVA